MRTIALCLDFDAIVFWFDEQGQEKIDEKTLDLSDELIRKLDELYAWFGDLYLDNDELPSDLDNRLFDDGALELWESLRAELAGRYNVIYYSREFMLYVDTPEAFRRLRADASA